nr:immunoglobulin light chain junction region [Macaca mulatta]MPO03007.1 immunoglobulin light chain junction region [Macaca mulatta]MPO03654.1 immunoglobulin light chain junction region [Macaca mulatta]MPO04019.1 immunoglobulin light chain junction region [Macaca mulatta]MPO04420.1 immunoglobulin light chain junction region [Macaca mulatta]
CSAWDSSLSSHLF